NNNKEVPQIVKDIISKAHKDAQYKKRLFDNPKDVLKEAGIAVPDMVEIRVYEKDQIHIEAVVNLENDTPGTEVTEAFLPW
ncbi:MAG TPA: NHLP leader peptide family RiPP precursor, partial [Clostridia bacterium]